jgi:hypothetical protein
MRSSRGPDLSGAKLMSKSSWGVDFAEEMRFRGRVVACPSTGNGHLYNESCAASSWQFFFFRRQCWHKRRSLFQERVSNRVHSDRLILRRTLEPLRHNLRLSRPRSPVLNHQHHKLHHR